MKAEGGAPTGAILQQFRPSKTFSLTIGGQVNSYIAGRVYYVREGCDELANAVAKKHREGKCALSDVKTKVSSNIGKV